MKPTSFFPPGIARFGVCLWCTPRVHVGHSRNSSGMEAPRSCRSAGSPLPLPAVTRHRHQISRYLRSAKLSFRHPFSAFSPRIPPSSIMKSCPHAAHLPQRLLEQWVPAHPPIGDLLLLLCPQFAHSRAAMVRRYAVDRLALLSDDEVCARWCMGTVAGVYRTDYESVGVGVSGEGGEISPQTEKQRFICPVARTSLWGCAVGTHGIITHHAHASRVCGVLIRPVRRFPTNPVATSR